jgi:glyoxylase-like metal-dependent hydrolase (beta-lactamase superfamily II)
VSENEVQAPPPVVKAESADEITEGVWVIPDGRVPLVPNIGIVAGADATLVVDTGMGPANGERVLRLAESLAPAEQMYLAVTHFHPEHGYGAQVFAPRATIVYNRSQLDEFHEKGAPYVEMFKTFGPAVAEQLEGVELVDPDVTFDTEHELDLGGGRLVRLLHFGLAHTRGDMVVDLPEEGILFTGDLVENRLFPIFPYFPPDDTDVSGARWIDVLEELEGLKPTVVVPGHGEVAGSELIVAARDYMLDVQAEVRQAVDAGQSADEAVARLESEIRERYAAWDAPEWIGFAIRAFHAELSA